MKAANKANFVVYSTRPELVDGVWMQTEKPTRLGFIQENKDVFVLLETNEANECFYPKILTTTGDIGYLYLHNYNNALVEVIDENNQA